MAFHFKQFSVEDLQSSMRVGTDAVLLGVWADVSNDLKILEIGAGCGVISLLLAQRSEARIDALEIDESSFLQAKQNFTKSPWYERLHAIHGSVQEFSKTAGTAYDHIITNPPFFVNSLRSPVASRNSSRHDELLSFGTLLKSVASLLKPEGKFSLILPVRECLEFVAKANDHGLLPARNLEIIPKKGKPVNRVLMEFSVNIQAHLITETLAIRKEDNSYTREYLNFTEDYYLSLK
jgi:tRNA1Val (adenine37-N6)-methyltransferase